MHDEVGGEFRVSLSSGTVLALRVPVDRSHKLLRKWVQAISKHSPPSGSEGVVEQGPQERELSRTIEECSFSQRLAEMAAARHQTASEQVAMLEKRLGELRSLVEASARKSSTLTLLTPVRKPGSRSEYVSRHQGCSIALLIEALRSKNATPEQTAKHL